MKHDVGSYQIPLFTTQQDPFCLRHSVVGSIFPVGQPPRTVHELTTTDIWQRQIMSVAAAAITSTKDTKSSPGVRREYWGGEAGCTHVSMITHAVAIRPLISHPYKAGMERAGFSLDQAG